MNKIEKTQKKGQKTLIAILIIGVAVYLGFSPLFNLINGGVAGAVIGASFGAIFVIVLTMYLLNKQTEIEQESKKSERVFDEKVQLYKEILSTTKNMIEDRVITSNEVTKLPFVLMKLQMLGGDDAISTYEKVFSKINEIFEKHDEEVVDIDENENREILNEMMKFTVQCRVDLGISDRIVNDELFERTKRTIEKSSELIEVRGGDAKATYVKDTDFYDILKERGIDAEVINITKKIHERFNQEFKGKRFDINFVATSETSTPQISLRAKNSKGKVNVAGALQIQKRGLKAGGNQHGCLRSPRWDYKRIKLGNIIFGNTAKFSFDKENNEFSGNVKHLSGLTSNSFSSMSAEELDGYILLLKESMNVNEDGTKLDPTSLINEVKSGNQNSIEQLIKVIDGDFHILSKEEIASAPTWLGNSL